RLARSQQLAPVRVEWERPEPDALVPRREGEASAIGRRGDVGIEPGAHGEALGPALPGERGRVHADAEDVDGLVAASLEVQRIAGGRPAELGERDAVRHQ